MRYGDKITREIRVEHVDLHAVVLFVETTVGSAVGRFDVGIEVKTTVGESARGTVGHSGRDGFLSRLDDGLGRIFTRKEDDVVEAISARVSQILDDLDRDQSAADAFLADVRRYQSDDLPQKPIIAPAEDHEAFAAAVASFNAKLAA